MIADLVRDVLWAKARVLAAGGWCVAPALDYLEACAPEIPFPLQLIGLVVARKLETERLENPREANMDGELHIEGECCGEDDIMGGECRAVRDPLACAACQEKPTTRWCSACDDLNLLRRCGARLHQQPVYGGIAELCERCSRNTDWWEPRGTYKVDSAGFITGRNE